MLYDRRTDFKNISRVASLPKEKRKIWFKGVGGGEGDAIIVMFVVCKGWDIKLGTKEIIIGQ